MEDMNKEGGVAFNDQDILFSKTIRAGKRIYYIDVKKNRKEELFLAITESKKMIQGEGDNAKVSFQKHKIFLYKEDFEKFTNGLHDALAYIEEKQGKFVPHYADPQLDSPQTEENTSLVDEELGDSDIKIDIDFD